VPAEEQGLDVLDEQPISHAMKVRKRATSSAPAWPMMRLVGKPVAFHAV
jgi:hypothetical protein